jgi:hypothetical protein
MRGHSNAEHLGGALHDCSPHASMIILFVTTQASESGSLLVDGNMFPLLVTQYAPLSGVTAQRCGVTRVSPTSGTGFVGGSDAG